MDRSVDSIGSCSLDVDADSSDISDTSGSLNFPTPISVKDITREFTTNIRERCSVRTVQTTAFADPVRGVRMVLTQPTSETTTNTNSAETAVFSALPALSSTVAVDVNQTDKKPSYLNLACCVNGYSNLTTYDSKVRQDINKSREVSPIRPSSSSIQYCKKSDSLAPPVLHKMHATTPRSSAHPESNNSNHHEYGNGTSNANGNGSYHNDGYGDEIRSSSSFIQQRVERLYGPGALAQGFYSPKKVRSYHGARSPHTTSPFADADASELTRKFKQLTPSRDYSDFRKKLSASESNAARHAPAVTHVEAAENNSIDLPVLRHLSQEFRAQLPMISPKRSIGVISPGRETSPTSVAQVNDVIVTQTQVDEVDHKALAAGSMENSLSESASAVIVQPAQKNNNGVMAKDAHHFLNLLKLEQLRILALAGVAEKYMDELANNPDTTEDTMGFLRAASGKARLLVSQKMKQFEGLCHNNLNGSPDDKFPTTEDDLQGFWDMVNLQVDHINSIFAEIEVLKADGWKKPLEESQVITSVKSQKSTKTAAANAKAKATNGNSSAKPAQPSAAALKRESQRKQLLEMKRKQRIALAAKTTTSASAADVETNLIANPIEIYVNESNSSISN